MNANAPRPATLLCVEDEPDIREAIVEELVDCGFQVIEAVNGSEGLRAVLERRPDLVVCDCLMPVMSGIELLQTLRRDHPDYADVPFIFLSAHANEAEVVRGKQTGAAHYLTKPIDLDLLVETVTRTLEATGEAKA